MEKIFYNLVKKHSELAEKIHNGKPLFLYWYSSLIFGIALFLSKIIKKKELSKLNKSKIKKYYILCGKEDTLNHFKLSENILNEILS